MKYNLDLKYITCYYENGAYEDGIGCVVSKEEKQQMLGYLYELNRNAYLWEATEENLRLFSGNIGFYKYKEHMVLFKTVCREVKGKIVSDMEGLVFDSGNERVVWMYLPSLLCFLYSEQFYDFQDKTALREDFLEEILNNKKFFLGLDKKIAELWNGLEKENRPFGFIRSCIDYDWGNLKVYRTSAYEMVAQHKKVNSVADILESVSVDLQDTDWNIELQAPSIGNLSKKEGFLKDRKEVKRQKKEGKVVCIAYRKKDKKNVCALPFVETGKWIQLDEIGQFLDTE